MWWVLRIGSLIGSALVSAPAWRHIDPLPVLGGRARLVEYLEKRETAITNEQLDPLQNGYEPPHWARVRELLPRADEILILGGNRSGKSSLTGKLAMEVLVVRRLYARDHLDQVLATFGLILFCNEAGHFKAGMYSTFTVAP